MIEKCSKPKGGKGGKGKPGGKCKPCRTLAIALAAMFVAGCLGASAQAGWVYLDDSTEIVPIQPDYCYAGYGYYPLIQVGPVNFTWRYRYRNYGFRYSETVKFRSY